MRNADAERLLTVRTLYDELPCSREIIDDVGVTELLLVGPPDEYTLVIVAIVSPCLIIHHVIKTFPDALVQGIEILFGGRRTHQTGTCRAAAVYVDPPYMSFMVVAHKDSVQHLRLGVRLHSLQLRLHEGDETLRISCLAGYLLFPSVQMLDEA